MNNDFYYIFTDEEEVVLIYLNESDEDAQEMCEAENLSSWAKTIVNPDHYLLLTVFTMTTQILKMKAHMRRQTLIL